MTIQQPAIATPAISAAGRQAGWPQGLSVSLVSIFAAMGVVLIAPILPKMQEHYANVPGAAVLVPIALTLPALMIALFSPLVGLLTDRFQRRPVLLGALVLYAIAGTAPLYLGSLNEIIISRLFVGLAEAALMTASTTLIGDYFSGGQREKWYAYQTGIASISAIFFFGIGGALGDSGWRTPFAVYAFSLVMLLAILVFTWEPKRRREQDVVAGAFPWGNMLGVYAISIFASVIFYTAQIQLPFILSQHGITAPGQIGIASALGSIAVPVGSLLFIRLSWLGVTRLLGAGFLLASLGLFGLSHLADFWPIVGVQVVFQTGCGLLLPTLLTWATSRLPFELRGRGTGLWTGMFFFGQFISPLVVLGIAAGIGGLLPAIQVLGVACIVSALVAGGVASRRGT